MTRIYSLFMCFAAIFCLTTTASAQALPSWNDTPTKAAIVAFVEKVTQKGSPDFVKPEDRIAVFDDDGTLWSEQPNDDAEREVAYDRESHVGKLARGLDEAPARG